MRATKRIARKNVRITLQKNAVSVDRYQNHINTWTDYFTCFAYANTYTLNENGEEVITEGRNITFLTRYCPELAAITSTGYRIIFNGEAYDIKAVDMMNYQNKELRFRCQREKHNGD